MGVDLHDNDGIYVNISEVKTGQFFKYTADRRSEYYMKCVYKLKVSDTETIEDEYIFSLQNGDFKLYKVSEKFSSDQRVLLLNFSHITASFNSTDPTILTGKNATQGGAFVFINNKVHIASSSEIQSNAYTFVQLWDGQIAVYDKEVIDATAGSILVFNITGFSSDDIDLYLE